MVDECPQSFDVGRMIDVVHCIGVPSMISSEMIESSAQP